MALSQSSKGSDPSDSSDLRVGDRVRHPVFGEGLVLETVRHGDDHMIKVSFPSDGSQRRLLASRAHLEKLGAEESENS